MESINPQHLLADGLLALAASHADANADQRRLQPELVHELMRSGAFRYLLPSELGGAQCTLPAFIEKVQALSQVDASTAWCVVQQGVIGLNSLWLDRAAASEVWADPNAAFANGPPLDTQLRKGAGSTPHALSGHWGFSSGCQHANWMTAACRDVESQRWYTAFFPKSVVEFVDDWQVDGLRGTGSFQFKVQKLSLPQEHLVDQREQPTFDIALTRIPQALIFAVCFAGVALGVAQSGLKATKAVAAGKHPIYASLSMKDDPDVHQQLAQAEARWRAGQAYLRATVAEIWQTVANGNQLTNAQRIDLRLCGTHVIREAQAVMEVAYTISGSTGIYNNHPLHRPAQDMRVISQHVQARYAHYALAGKYLAGHPFKATVMS